MPNDSFNSGEPLGYFLTWTTYGTWLPGDTRGWQRKGESEPQIPSETISQMASTDMKEPAFRLQKFDRQVVEKTIVQHCKIRNWFLHAVNVRSNHVHVVLTAAGYQPQIVRDQLKAWCSRKLKANQLERTRFWTQGASHRWLNTDESLAAAIEYVKDFQDRH